MCKFIFVTGGVVSGLGKGITAASLGRLLKARGLKVASQKLDPYINVDPGTMSPFQHGEVYVTEDGAETDLDLGHYERFINEDLNRFSNLTTGKVYWNVLNKERRGEYLGKTVQVIPHITNEIKDFIYSAANHDNPDILICEIGGTVGDIESQPFLEAVRQIGLEAGKGNALFIHVTLIPYLECSKEHKSKPTQHSVKTLQGLGINPDILVLRCSHRLEKDIFGKLALFCNIKEDCIIENRTLPVLYEAPLMLERQHLGDIVCRELGIKANKPDLHNWKDLVVFGHGVGVRAGGVHHVDPELAGVADVDVVEAGSGTDHELQVLQAVHDLGRDLLAADDDRGCVGVFGGQIGQLHVRVLDHGETVFAQDFFNDLVEFGGNEDFSHACLLVRLHARLRLSKKTWSI